MKNNKEYLATEAKRHLIICEIAKGTRYTDVVKKLSIPYFEQKKKFEDKKNQKDEQEDEK